MALGGVRLFDPVEGTVVITQAEPTESVKMKRDHAESVLSAHDSLSTKLSLQQFYDIVQGVWKQHPDATPKAIATYIDVYMQEFHITDQRAIITRINQFLEEGGRDRTTIER